MLDYLNGVATEFGKHKILFPSLPKGHFKYRHTIQYKYSIFSIEIELLFNQSLCSSIEPAFASQFQRTQPNTMIKTDIV